MEQLHGRISLLSSAVCVISVGHLKGCWQLDVYSRLPSSPESWKCLYNHESTSNIRPLLPEFMLCFILKLKWPLRMRDIIIFTVQSSCEGSNGNLFQSFISNQKRNTFTFSRIKQLSLWTLFWCSCKWPNLTQRARVRCYRSTHLILLMCDLVFLCRLITQPQLVRLFSPCGDLWNPGVLFLLRLFSNVCNCVFQFSAGVQLLGVVCVLHHPRPPEVCQPRPLHPGTTSLSLSLTFTSLLFSFSDQSPDH